MFGIFDMDLFSMNIFGGYQPNEDVKTDPPGTQIVPDKNGESLTLEKLHKMLELVIPETPLFFTSELIEDDACYEMRPDQISFYASANLFDKNTKLVYVCGKNVRDALIKKGVFFQNYKPEVEK